MYIGVYVGEMVEVTLDMLFINMIEVYYLMLHNLYSITTCDNSVIVE